MHLMFRLNSDDNLDTYFYFTIICINSSFTRVPTLFFSQAPSLTLYGNDIHLNITMYQ